MKKGSTIFLQIAIVLMATLTLAMMIRFPLTEGRAIDLDLIGIYSDPFIIYGYITSIAFFIALYQAFKLLGFIRQNKVFSQASIKALRIIKYCGIVLSVLVVLAAVYIRIFHSIDDDPAGFIAIAILVIFGSSVVSTAAGVFEKILQDVIEKSKNGGMV